MVVLGTPGWHVQGCTPGVHPWTCPPRGTQDYPAPPPLPHHAAQEWASGLNRPRGERVGMGSAAEAASRFSYLRSFWPGIRIPVQGIRGKCWIGTRAFRPWGPMDVSDLELLSRRCGKSRIWRRRSQDPARPAGSWLLRRQDPALFVIRRPWTLF